MEENLLIDYFEGRLDDGKQQAVEEWLSASPANRLHYRQCAQIWSHAPAASQLQDLDVEEDLQAVKRRSQIPTRKNNRWIGWSVAAMLLLGLGLLFYQNEPSPQMTSTDDYPSMQFALSDGSEIQLNAHSKLIYPKEFTGDKREVELQGQARFKITADPAHPFLIRHGNSTTEVVGTEFDIEAYSEREEVLIRVVEGVVKVHFGEGEKQSLLLTVGQELSLGASPSVVNPIRDRNFDAWHTGRLIFENENLEEVIESLNAHFDAQIKLSEGESGLDCQVRSSFDNQSLDSILEELAVILGFEYLVKGDEILILQVKC